jgi:hypothetical protein
MTSSGGHSEIKQLRIEEINTGASVRKDLSGRAFYVRHAVEQTLIFNSCMI